MRQTTSMVLCALAFAVPACGSDVEPSPDDGAGGATGAATTVAETASSTGSTGGPSQAAGSQNAAGSGGAAPIDCSGLELLAPAEEIAKTPRQDLAAEHLARETSGAFVAPDDLYATVIADLAAIRAVEPAVGDIQPRAVAPSGLSILWLTPELDPSSYHAWDCLNAAYGMEVQGGDDEGGYVFLQSDPDRYYDTAALAVEYAKLPNVNHANNSCCGGDGPDVCLELRGDDRYYVFDDAGGDCPAGCTTHIFYGFRVQTGETPEVLGVHHDESEDGGPPLPMPAWLDDLVDCRDRLGF